MSYQQYYSNYYSPAESSSSALSRNSAQSMPSDLPELYYDDGGLPTPPSSSVANMICTPPQDWHSAWQPAVAKSTNATAYSHPTWQGARPMVAPIDTSFNDWAHTDAAELYARYDDIGLQPQFDKHASYTQGLLLTQPITGFNLASPSPLFETVSPAALTIANPSPSPSPAYPPPLTQAPMKLHQPRPSRRIPIVSLDKLASACEEEASINFHRSPKCDSETLTLSPLDFNSRSSLPSSHQPTHQTHQQYIFPNNNSYPSNIPRKSNQEMEKVLICKCGCMGSYTFNRA